MDGLDRRPGLWVTRYTLHCSCCISCNTVWSPRVVSACNPDDGGVVPPDPVGRVRSHQGPVSVAELLAEADGFIDRSEELLTDAAREAVLASENGDGPAFTATAAWRRLAVTSPRARWLAADEDPLEQLRDRASDGWAYGHQSSHRHEGTRVAIAAPAPVSSPLVLPSTTAPLRHRPVVDDPYAYVGDHIPKHDAADWTDRGVHDPEPASETLQEGYSLVTDADGAIFPAPVFRLDTSTLVSILEEAAMGRRFDADPARALAAESIDCDLGSEFWTAMQSRIVGILQG